MYSKVFREERYSHISPIIEKMLLLQPGEKVQIAGLEREDLVETRYLIYDYLSHVGTKSLFRLKTDEDILIIKRLGLPLRANITTDKGARPNDDLLALLVKEDNQEKAEEMMTEWIKNGKITASEAADLLLRLKQILT